VFLISNCPVNHPKAIDPAEVCSVVGGDSQPFTERNVGGENIHSPNQQAAPFEIRPDVSRNDGCIVIERQKAMGLTKLLKVA